MMDVFLQHIVSGLTSGAIYSGMALSIVMIYVAIANINFAQGEMGMFAAFVAWQLLEYGINLPLAIFISLAFAFCFGVATERLIFRHLQKASLLSNVAAFIALFVIVNGVAGVIWGYTIKNFPLILNSPRRYAHNLIGNQEIIIGSAIIMLGILLYVFLSKTRLGLSMRAAASTPDSAVLVGINTNRTIGVGWGMATIISGVTALLIAPIVYLEPNMMLGILIYGFAGAVLGGVNSLPGAVVGGLLVGVLENLIGAYVIGDSSGELKLPITLGLIIFVLTIRPSGIMGKKTVVRV